MSLEQETNRPSVYDYFSNPMQQPARTVTRPSVTEEGTDGAGISEHLHKYLDEKAITEMIKVNSEIEKIFNKFKIPIKINMGILDHLVNNHLSETRKIAIGIANHLHSDYQKLVNRKALSEATSLHDLAKVIIPENIINKNGSLNEEELAIMRKHSDLSYEMLKSTDLDSETLNLIKNHHHDNHSAEHCHDDLGADINLQILSVADKYSALREKRSYKKAFSAEQSLEIIHQEVIQGKFHTCVYEALTNYVYKEDESLAQFQSQRQVVNFESVNSLSS